MAGDEGDSNGVKEVLVLAGKLHHHAAFAVRPGRYFVRRLLRMNGPGAGGDGGDIRREQRLGGC